MRGGTKVRVSFNFYYYNVKHSTYIYTTNVFANILLIFSIRYIPTTILYFYSQSKFYFSYQTKTGNEGTEQIILKFCQTFNNKNQFGSPELSDSIFNNSPGALSA